MRFCERHWTALRDAIDTEGLSHLIARDGNAAVSNLVSELETGSRRENFDPLMGAHWAIINRIAEHQPGVVFVDGCPLCWVQDGHEEHCSDPACPVTRQTFEDWIPSVAKHMRETHEQMVKDGTA